ncbi:MAG TPA: hypothetical protein VL688_07610 [Verrucomicrobiae bacterium]|nr:hypothetical protein [Verrucomicrobiae bacterium]
MKISAAFLFLLFICAPALFAALPSNRQQTACALDPNSSACKQLIEQVRVQQSAVESQLDMIGNPTGSPSNEGLFLPSFGQDFQDPSKKIQ